MTRPREVEIGIASFSLTEIRAGLEEGELVVTGRAGLPAATVPQGGRTGSRMGPPRRF